MPLESLELSVILPGPPERIYEAWLDSRHHAAFTGGGAEIEPGVGGAHSAWDGYITGQNLELEPGRRIVQSWRTTEFPEDAAFSRLEILLEPAEGGTRLTLKHTEIPEGQGEQYEEGWRDYYFEPMLEYFTNLAVSPAVVGAIRVIAPEPVAAPAPAPAPARAPAVRPKAKARAKPAAKKPAKKVAPKKAAAKKKAAPKKKVSAKAKAMAKAKPKKGAKRR
jgi:uncharacterized protein YndB with AHSA1/START domain